MDRDLSHEETRRVIDELVRRCDCRIERLDRLIARLDRKHQQSHAETKEAIRLLDRFDGGSAPAA